MAIEHYTDVYWFPNGTLANGIPARVFPINSNTLAPLYTDATGTTPLPNPINTTALGVLDFWAEAGEYWIYIDAQVFRVTVGVPRVDLGEAATLAVGTGIVSGGEINVNGTNPAAIDISPLVGYVVDYLTDAAVPTITRVSTPAQTVALVGASLTRVVTWWVMDAAGTVTQQANRPDAVQRRTHIVLGATAYDPGTGNIFIDQTLPVILSQQANQLADLMDALGPFSITGNVITPNGANLTLAKTAGTVFARAFNHFSGGTPTGNPHVSPTPGQVPVSLRRLYRVAQFPPPATFTTIDPTLWDNNGVLTPVTGNDATIQRVWLFPANAPADQIAVQYGQQLHATFADALDALGQGDYVRNPTVADNAALIAYIIVRGDATALNNINQCIIKVAGKFDRP